MSFESKLNKVKATAYKHEYNPDQILELFRCEVDPKYFIEKYCKIQHPAVHGMIPLKLYEKQSDLVDVYTTSTRSIALMSRQSGKDTTTMAFLLQQMIFKPDQTILVAAPNDVCAKGLLSVLKIMYEELPHWLKPGCLIYNAHRVEFDNGSRISVGPATPYLGRGQSISLLYLSEFAYVRPSVQYALLYNLYPAISTGGRCIITSSANNDDDRFARIWANATPSPYSDELKNTVSEKILVESKNDPMDQGFIGFHANWRSVPGRDDAFKERMLSMGSQADWDRDYECHFGARRG